MQTQIRSDCQTKVYILISERLNSSCYEVLNCWCSWTLVRTGRLFTKWKFHLSRVCIIYIYIAADITLTVITAGTFPYCLDLPPRLAAMQLARSCWCSANLSQWQIGLDVMKQFRLSFPNASHWLFIRWMKRLLARRCCNSMLVELEIWKQCFRDSKSGMNGITFGKFA